MSVSNKEGYDNYFGQSWQKWKSTGANGHGVVFLPHDFYFFLAFFDFTLKMLLNFRLCGDIFRGFVFNRLNLSENRRKNRSFEKNSGKKIDFSTKVEKITTDFFENAAKLNVR